MTNERSWEVEDKAKEIDKYQFSIPYLTRHNNKTTQGTTMFYDRWCRHATAITFIGFDKIRVLQSLSIMPNACDCK